MRPGRLGQIFDHRRDLLVALDQQDVAGLKRAAQRVGVGRRVGLVAGGFVLQPAGKPAAKAVEKRVAGAVMSMAISTDLRREPVAGRCGRPASAVLRRCRALRPDRRAPCGRASSSSAWGCRRTARPPRQGRSSSASSPSASGAWQEASCPRRGAERLASASSSARMTNNVVQVAQPLAQCVDRLAPCLDRRRPQPASSDRCMPCVLAALRRSWKSSASPRVPASVERLPGAAQGDAGAFGKHVGGLFRLVGQGKLVDLL